MASKTRTGLATAAVLLLAAGAAQAQYVEITPSTATASANDGNVPSNAVDNNASTRWSASGDGQWLELNLGSTRTVGYVTIAFYKGNERQARFTLQYSNGGSWTPILSNVSSSGTSTAAQTFDFADVSASRLRYLGHGNNANAWNSVAEISVYAVGTGGPTPRPTATPTPTPVPGGGTWRRANLTNFESYPDPDSEECREYNGCTWAGMFAFVNGKQPESWVRANNIAALHQRDANRYRLKMLRLRQGSRQIDVKVYDMCADSDCNGCCTRNANAGGIGFLIDIEKYTMQRFGSGSGVVDWQCLDCN